MIALKEREARVIRTIAIAGLVFVNASLLAGLARAAPLQTTEDVKGHCSAAGDVYFPPGTNGTYACLKKDGSGVVCGGYNEKYKNSCDTWPADSTPSSRAPDDLKKKHAERKKK
jgi:hypothetical protein